MAFSVTVKSPMSKAERLSKSLAIYAGQITISSYATTLVECTAITKYFRNIDHTGATPALFPDGIVSCVADALSESGFAFKWDATTGAFRCYYPTSVSFAVDSDIGSPAATLHYDSGGGTFAGVMHALSGSGEILHESVGTEANANDAVGTVNFIAIGFV